MQNREDSEHVFQQASPVAPAEVNSGTTSVFEGDVLTTGSATDPVSKAKAANNSHSTDSTGVHVPHAQHHQHHNSPHHMHHNSRGTGHEIERDQDGNPITAENEGWWRWTWRGVYNGLVGMTQAFYTTGEAVGRRQPPSTKIIESQNRNYWAAPPTEAELKKQEQARRGPVPLPSQIPAGPDTDDISEISDVRDVV